MPFLFVANRGYLRGSCVLIPMYCYHQGEKQMDKLRWILGRKKIFVFNSFCTIHSFHVKHRYRPLDLRKK
jgi:hypothetical protein